MKFLLVFLLTLLLLASIAADQSGIAKEDMERNEFKNQCRQGWVFSCLMSEGYKCEGKPVSNRLEFICEPPENEKLVVLVSRIHGSDKWVITQLPEDEAAKLRVRKEKN